jgi:hemerythrin superfamily protein
MDVTKILEHDHRTVENLFDEIEKADGDARRPLLDELVASLRGHMRLEEDVLYPAMQPVTGDETMQEALTEHELARRGLEDLLDLAPDAPGFGAALEAVKAGISHHVDEEEHEVFPKLRSQGAGVLDEVATAFMQQRAELGLAMEPDALAAASTKDELVTEAKSADVEGASSMTKDELASALADRMSRAS